MTSSHLSDSIVSVEPQLFDWNWTIPIVAKSLTIDQIRSFAEIRKSHQLKTILISIFFQPQQRWRPAVKNTKELNVWTEVRRSDTPLCGVGRLLYIQHFSLLFSVAALDFSHRTSSTHMIERRFEISHFSFFFLPSPSHYVWFHFIFAISSPWQRSVCTIKKKASKTIARIEFPPFFAACPLSDGNFTSSLFFCRQDDVRDFFIPIQFFAEEWSLSRYHQTTMIHSVELLEYSYFHWVFFLCNRLNDTTSAVVTYIAALETSKYWRDEFSSFLHSICTTLSRGMNIVFCTFHSLLLTSSSQRPMLN